MEMPAPLRQIPLFVRAGSILPLGPTMEWSTEKPADPIELRIYRGADGDFTLYEDENDNYNYEKGAYATIPLHWDEANVTLTIGDCNGEFPGMLKTRTFNIVFVGENHGVGVEATAQADKTVQYSGSKLEVTP
jgi:alpha-D-xyloside xylohydrolase